MQQATRQKNRALNRSLKRDRWALAFPLVCWIIVLFAALTGLSLAASFHHDVHVSPVAANLVFWGLLGTVMLCMPVLSWLQGEKLGWQRNLRQIDASLSAARSKLLDSLRRLAAAHEIEILAPALFKGLLTPPPQAPSGRSLPSITLTPRLLAQRPQAARVPRG